MSRELSLPASIRKVESLEEMALFVARLKEQGPVDVGTLSLIVIRKIEIRRAH